jgi:hypothetical protein
MLTSLASIQLESDSRRFGNPNRFIPVGKCSSEITGASIQRLLAAPLKEILKMFAGLPV